MTQSTPMPHSYSNGVAGERILICGPLPPPEGRSPYGGIAQHVARVKYVLAQHNVVRVCDTAPLGGRVARCITLVRAIMWRPRIVYYHTLYHGMAEWLTILLGRVLLRYQLVILEHSTRHLVHCRPYHVWLVRIGMRYGVNKQVFIGFVNRAEYQLRGIFVDPLATVESAFISPEPDEYTSVDEDIAHFIEQHNPVLLINGSAFVSHEGKDLYGFDAAVQLLARLAKVYPRCGLLVMVGIIGDSVQYKIFTNLVASLGVTLRVFCVMGRRLLPVLPHVHVMLRPTMRDGYAISIEEALAAGVPVVASDVTTRPMQVHVYPWGNDDALYSLVLKILENDRSRPACAACIAVPGRQTRSPLCDSHSHLQ